MKKLKKITYAFSILAITFFVISCEKQNNSIVDEGIVEQTVSTRSLECVIKCNWAGAKCWGQNAGEGNTLNDLNEYYLCKCVDNYDDEPCVWMGSNNTHPGRVTCEDLKQIIVDRVDLCYIKYVNCINACGPPHSPEDRTKDTDKDGEPDWMDTDDDNDGIPDHLDNTPKGNTSTGGNSGTTSSSGTGTGSTSNNPPCGSGPPCPSGERCVKGICKPN